MQTRNVVKTKGLLKAGTPSGSSASRKLSLSSLASSAQQSTSSPAVSVSILGSALGFSTSRDKHGDKDGVIKQNDGPSTITTISLQNNSLCGCGSSQCKKPCALSKRGDSALGATASEITGMNHRSSTTSPRLSATNISKSVPSKTPSSPRWAMQGASTSLLETALSKSTSANIDRSASSPSTVGYTAFPSPKLSSRSHSPSVGIFIQSSSSPMTRKRTSSISAYLGNSSISSSLELSNVFSGSGSFGNEEALEKEFCKDFWCCGLVLDDLHELNKHIQECHPELSPMTQASQNALDTIGLDALFLNELIPGPYSDNLDSAVDSQSLDNPVDSVSPKQSFFTPPTSLSPYLSPNGDAITCSTTTFDEPEPFAFSEEDDAAFLFKNPRRRDSHDTLTYDEESKPDLDFLNTLDPDLFDGTDPSVASMFEDSAIGLEILNRLGNVNLQQPEDVLDQLSVLIANMKRYPDFTNPTEAGPLLNSGALESRSPPVAPIVRFGPHPEESFVSSSISLADIYQEDDEGSVDGLLFPLESPHTFNILPGTNGVESPQVFSYDSSDDSEMSMVEEAASASSSSEEEDFEIDIETWETAPTSSAASSSHYLDDDDDLDALSSHPLQRYNSAPLFNDTPSSRRIQLKRRPTIPLKIRLTSSATRSNSTPSLASNNNKSAYASSSSSKPTKKMRVGISTLRHNSLLSVQVDPDSVITASSPVLTPPNALLRMKQRRSSRCSSTMSELNDDDLVETTRSSRAGDYSRRVSALSAALAASRDDGLPRKLSRKAVSMKVEEDDLMDEEEDFYFPEVKNKRKVVTPATSSGRNNRKKDIDAVTASRKKTSGEPKAPANRKKLATSSGASTPPVPIKETLKLDPEFVKKFKTRAIAEVAHMTQEALAAGTTLAELVLERLPKIKEGDEKRLKLGSLSIIDPESDQQPTQNQRSSASRKLSLSSLASSAQQSTSSPAVSVSILGSALGFSTSRDKHGDKDGVIKQNDGPSTITTISLQNNSLCGCGSSQCKKPCALSKRGDSALGATASEITGMNHRSSTTSPRLSATNISKSVPSKTPSSPRWAMQGASTSLLETALSKSTSANIDRSASSPSTVGYTAFTSPKLSSRSHSPSVGIFIQSSSSPMTRKRTSSISAFLGNSLSSSLELSNVLSGSGSFGNEEALEKEFCKDFWCCGLVLDDLHELNKHIQECHPDLSPMTQASQNALDTVGLDALFLNELIPGPYSDNLDSAVDSQSLDNPVDSVSPKQSFFTPPTSLSPYLSPNGDATTSSTTLDEPEPFAFSEEDDAAFLFKNPRRRDSHDTLTYDEESKPDLDFLTTFDLDLFDVADSAVASMFEDSVVGLDILNRLGNVNLQQAEDVLDQSLALMLLQPDFTNPTEAGPLLNSGALESRSPPVAPIVRFGPHHEETFVSSSISLADIYQEDDEGSVDGLLFPIQSSPQIFNILPGTNGVESPQVFKYDSSDAAEMSMAEEAASASSSSEEEDFEIDIETWETAPTSSAASSSHYLDDDDDLDALSSHPLQRYNSAPLFNDTPSSRRIQLKRRPTVPLKIRLTSSATRSNSTPSLASNNNKSAYASSSSSKPTKKMRVGTSTLRHNSLLSVQINPDSVITASSPVLSPPNALLRMKQRRSSRCSSTMSELNDDDLVETTRSSRAGDYSRRVSALSAALAASRDDGLPRKLSRKAVSMKVEEDDLMDEEEDFYFPEVKNKRKVVTPATSSGRNNRKKDIDAVTASRKKTSGEPKAPANRKKLVTSSGTSTPPVPVKETIKLDPEFVKKFKTRAIAEVAHMTQEALAAGTTLAELVLERLPKIKEGDEKRLKLGSLSIIDPESAEKRFFCPVCKKEYKNANGLKYHLNHSHTKPNELPSGYYFGKKKKEAEDLTKPFVCLVVGCGKRYKNLNGLKYHSEHGHLPGAILMDPSAAAAATASANASATPESDDSDDDSDDE
ncbi:UNVERIFIED_CONTAM: Transcriptional regulator of ribosomal biogenesis proteins [Siphonaria sp. JEL0065]|nr:Transcriptional regulator of ribosomal biogenesis proteins [Siphonaria sp. JEL0065]